jgi:transposase
LTLPPGSTDENPVETIWQYLRVNRLVISIFVSCDAIVDACRAAWNRFGNDPNTVTSITPRAQAKVS